MSSPEHPIVWLHHADQHLGLVPTLGGGVAAWQADRTAGSADRIDLWRPWDGISLDMYKLASFAMVPWSNRISGGGFEHGGRFHAMAPNRQGEPYPIHGDGWLQPWEIAQPAADTLQMSLHSRCHLESPYHYECVQTFRLVNGGLDQSVQLHHKGSEPLPYGIGLHPWFLRAAGTRITAPVQGVWLSGPDPLPTEHVGGFPPSWNLNEGISAHGTLIDNAYTGWGGIARVDQPEQGLSITAHMPDFEQDGGVARHYCLVYRPPQGEAFCFEPVSQPIDAFHLPGRPGLRVLAQGEHMALKVQWRYSALSA